MKNQKTVDTYIARHPDWQKVLTTLRNIVCSTELEETVKWGMPVYTLNGKNVVGLGAFKSYAGIWFFQGAFLKDEKKVLINAQRGKTKGMRQWRFQSAGEIDKSLVRQYVEEAIENQRRGKEIKPAKPKAPKIPPELKQALAERPELKQSFEDLTPGKQREYAEYIAEAKMAETKQRRLEKIRPKILEGKGLNDKYKK
jgi:uncharacterized protein YdeI (YjbR/CyaY-like superfamily)